MNRPAPGWTSGFFGMLIFSGTLPATRLAVADLDPVFLTAFRALVAGGLAFVLLTVLRQPRPQPGDRTSLALVALGVVIGFPLLTAMALERMTAAQSLVFVGLLPLVTAVFGVLRAGDRPHPAFWVFALLGAALVAGYALSRGGGLDPLGSAMMMAGLLVCGLGYAEGARVSRRLGGWQAICWALVLAWPLMFALCFVAPPATLAEVSGTAWMGVAYVALFSMLIGCVLWYRGLARGGVAAVGQLLLLQPFFGMGLAALLLGEHVGAGMLAVTAGIVACVFAARAFAGRPAAPSAFTGRSGHA